MIPLQPPQNPAWPGVSILDVVDPLLGGAGGPLNAGTEALHERTEYLRQAVEGPDGLASRVGDIEGVGVGAIARAVPLGWLYGSATVALELWVPGYTLRGEMLGTIAVTGTVAGDDSVDVESTNGLAPGVTYVISGEDGTAVEVVTVAQVLSATRLRATAALTMSRGTGRLGRSSARVVNAVAFFQPGGRYYSARVTALKDVAEGRVFVRRDTESGGVVDVLYRPVGEVLWQPALRLATVQRAADSQDDEWSVPGGTDVELQLQVSGGVAETRIDHVAVAPLLQGVATLVDRPVVISPAAGAVGLTGTPTIALSPYRSLYGVGQAAVQIQIGRDPLFSLLTWTGDGADVSSLQVPPDTLTVDTVYWLRGRYQDADGVWSPWSPAVTVTTGATLAYVQQPQLTAPAAGASAVAIRPTLTCAPFAVVGDADTHAASQWRVASDAGMATIVHASGDVAGGALLSYTLPVDLAVQTDYWLQVRHKGTALGYSAWSAPVKVRTQAQPSAPSITSPAPGAVGVPVRPTIATTGFLVVGQADSHAATQIQVAASNDAAFAAPIRDLTLAAVTSYTLTVAESLTEVTTFHVRARHRGNATGWGPWSAAITFTTETAAGSVTIATPGPGVFVVPAGVTRLHVALTGGGGPGSGSGPGGERGGGGAGTGWKNDIAVVPGQQIPYHVGRGGLGVRSGDAPDGETTSFGAFCSATGGEGAKLQSQEPGALLRPGVGGVPVGCDGGGVGGAGGAGGGGAGGLDGKGGDGNGQAGQGHAAAGGAGDVPNAWRQGGGGVRHARTGAGQTPGAGGGGGDPGGQPSNYDGGDGGRHGGGGAGARNNGIVPGDTSGLGGDGGDGLLTIRWGSSNRW